MNSELDDINIPKVGDTFQHDFIFTEEQILKYANISGDSNPIHISESYAEKSIFKRCIVHGYFSISIFSKVYGTLLYPDGNILISQTAKYLKPVFTNIEYSAVFRIKELFPDKNRILYVNKIFEKQTGELNVTGESVLMNKIFYKW